jgi:hypothetical protein
MSVGPLSCADAPTPFTPPAAPLPASVDTRPEGATLRIRWFEASLTNKLPTESMETPWGELNEAAVPKPFVKAAFPEPAKVVTMPKGVMRRTR